MSRLRTIEKNQIPKVAHVEDYDSDESSIKPGTRKEARWRHTSTTASDPWSRLSKTNASDSGYASLPSGEQASRLSTGVKRYEDDRPESGRRWDRDRFERYDAGQRWNRGVYEDDRYARESGYDRPPPVTIREERPSKFRQQEIDKFRLEREGRGREEFSEIRTKPPPEDDYFYGRRVVESERSRSPASRSEIRPKQPESGYSSDDSYEYVRRERTYSDHEDEPQHKRSLAEGALAGIGATEIVPNSPLTSALLGGIGSKAVRRARSKDRYRFVYRRTSRSHSSERQQDRRHGRDSPSRSRSRSRSISRRPVPGLASAAAIGALAGYALKNNDKRKAISDFERGPQRSRSRGRRASADESGDDHVSRSRSRGLPTDSSSPFRSHSTSDTPRRQATERSGIAGLAKRALKKKDREEALSLQGKPPESLDRSGERLDDAIVETTEKGQNQHGDMRRELDVVAPEVQVDLPLTPPPESTSPVEAAFPTTQEVPLDVHLEFLEPEDAESAKGEVLAKRGEISTHEGAAATLDQFDFKSFLHQREGQWSNPENSVADGMLGYEADFAEYSSPNKSAGLTEDEVAKPPKSDAVPMPRDISQMVEIDKQDIPWIRFKFSRRGVEKEYKIRCDVQTVDVNGLSPQFKIANSAYGNAFLPKNQGKGDWLEYRKECNRAGWALTQLNPQLEYDTRLIRRAVDVWRNSDQDPQLRSRRVRRQGREALSKTVGSEDAEEQSIGAEDIVTDDFESEEVKIGKDNLAKTASQRLQALQDDTRKAYGLSKQSGSESAEPPQDTASKHTRRSLRLITCNRCKMGKVKCDATETSACSWCQRLGFECVVPHVRTKAFRKYDPQPKPPSVLSRKLKSQSGDSTIRGFENEWSDTDDDFSYYDNDFISSAHKPPWRKPACDRCRMRKTMCDISEPCGPCARTGSPCVRTEYESAKGAQLKRGFEAPRDVSLSYKSVTHSQVLEDMGQEFDINKTTSQEVRSARREDAPLSGVPSTEEIDRSGTGGTDKSLKPQLMTRVAAAFAIPQPLLRLMRSRLLPGYQRLEWRCSCGKQMYGDHARHDVTEQSKLFQSLPDCKVLESTRSLGIIKAVGSRRSYVYQRLQRILVSRLWRPTLAAILKDVATWAGIWTCSIYSSLPQTHYFKIVGPTFDSNSLHNYGFRTSGPRSLRTASRLLEFDRAVIAGVAIIVSGFGLIKSLEYVFATRWRRRMLGMALAFPINLIMSYLMGDIGIYYYEIVTSLIMCAGFTMDILETWRDNLLDTKRYDAATTENNSPSDNNSNPSHQAAPSSSQGTSSTPATTSGTSSGTMAAATPANGTGAPPSQGNVGTGFANSTTILAPLDAAKPAFFELCVNGSKTRVALGEITLSDGAGRSYIRTDMELFKKIHEQYNLLRRKGLYKYLYRPTNIHFIRFGVHRGGYQTGIYERPLAVPPAEEVENQRYHYYECPLDPLPPIDPGTFFHYFWEHDKHPHTTGHPGFDSLFFNRLPKKLGDSVLKQDDPGKLQKGWGVHIIEGPNKPLLAWLATAILVSSFLISLIYDIVFKNKESGFAIGQWIVAVLATALTAMYFHLADLA